MRRVLPLAVTALLLAPAARAAGPAVDFRRDVRPILAEHCFLCHGPDEKGRKGGLRLDARDDALKAGDSGEAAVVPGKPADSAVIRRVTSDDPTEVMPPPRHKKALSARQVETLTEWVRQGAPYDGHWAFTPPRKAPVPAGKAAHPIDAFALARLEKADLGLSPPAAAEVLCRRLYLDLVGLPPTPREADEFVAAAAKDRAAAVAALADRLLASPHFGEKWARHWLDLARYADSDGYEKDLPRQQWAYRDWVVRAVNADVPYDRFLVEQLAGDLLPNPSQDQVVATGFLRNSMVNEEGAILAEQFRVEAMFDRMDAVGKAVLGLSLQCAQCHTHKYDPISQTEYFRLFAFLNNDFEATSWVYTPAQQVKARAVRDAVAAAEEAFKASRPDWPAKLAGWEASRKAAELPWDVLKPADTEVIGGLAHPDVLPDGSVITLGHKVVRGELWVTGTAAGRLTGLRLDALTHGDLPFNGPGRSYKGTFALAELVVEAAPASAGEHPKWEKVPLAGATADLSPAERPLEPYYHIGKDGKPDARKVGPAAFLADGKDDTAWCPDRGPGRRNESSHAVVRFAKPVEHPGGTRLKVTLKFRHAGEDPYGRTNNFLGRFRLSTTTAPDPAADPYGPDVRAALAVPAGKRTPTQADAVFAAWLAAAPDGADAVAVIDKLWADFPEAETTVLHLAPRPAEHARATRLLDRGAWDKPKEAVEPGGVAALHPLPKGAELSRLTFARWLAARENPLTARVAVNRVWQAVWGTGLVETAEEFGTRGSPPTHPELLDWLAVEFMDRGWSLKQLLRTVVTSAAYQQSARVTPALLEKDPKNALLSRGPRFRPDAEVVRDVVLAASGLLDPTVGGPFVYPPVPDSLLALSFAKVDFWKTAEGRDRYRRSLYVFRRRSLPDPLLSCFDAPTGDTATPRRGRSNTPLAALAALNEPVMVEAARAFALRVLREGGPTDAARAAYAFRLCTARTPTPAEADALLDLVRSRRAKIAEGWLSPRELTTGDARKLPDLPAGATPADAAAWAVAARVLLNLDETLTKN